jgi:hypothetical protein
MWTVSTTFVDATEWVDEIRVPKSAEEIELIRGAAAFQDACVEHLKGFISSQGYAPPLRSFAHGQGYPLVERPNLRPDETWNLKANTDIAVHP